MLAIAGFLITRARGGESLCAAGPSRFDRVLSHERRASLDALAARDRATPGPLGEERAARRDRLGAALDDYRRDWVERYRASCESTRVRRDQSESDLDLEMACLESRLASADVVASLLEKDDSEIVETLATRSALAPLDRCSDAKALRQVVGLPKDPATRGEIASLRARIQAMTALDTAGQFKRARADGGAIVARARELAYGPALAEALFGDASAEQHDGAFEPAATHLTEAILAAYAAHDDDLVARARTRKAYLVGVDLGRAAEGTGLFEEAAAAIHRAGDDPRLDADLAGYRAEIARKEGSSTELIDLAARAVEAARRAYGEASLDEASAENRLGGLLAESPRPADAIPHFDRALAIEEAKLGAHHPWTLLQRSDRASALLNAARVPEARDEAKKLVEMTEAAFGMEHRPTADALLLQGAVLMYEPSTRAEAPPVDERAIAILEKLLPADHLELATARIQLGEALMANHGFTEAEAVLAKALAALSKGPRDIQLCGALGLHGETLVELGRVASGVPELEQALEIADAIELDGRRTAVIEFAIARGVRGRDRPRAVKLARDALAKLADDPIADEERMAAVRAWLAKNGR